ncbi:5-guanidino-2-oxopentanoate decarboxylase [Clostridiaceae bacterium 35-E11]
MIITGGEIITKTLERLGVDTLFGIPGIHNLDIYDGLLHSKINHITTRNESGAGFMADGYARSTGRPGVALVITGPGLTNIITPMGQAMHDGIPMLVISSQIPSTVLGQETGFLHELKNSTILAQSVAKESRSVPCIEAIETYIQEAYHLCQTGRPGPVHIEIPMDILKETMNSSQTFLENPHFFSKNTTSNLNHTFIQQAIDSINDGKQVALMVGGGAAKAGKQIVRLAEKLHAPIIQTLAGKGIVDERHSLCLGARLHFQEVRALLMKMDVVIAIGTQLSPTDLWEEPLQLKGKLIQIDLDAGAFNKNYPADLGIKGDAGQIIEKLLPALEEKNHVHIPDVLADIIVKTKSRLAEVTGISNTMELSLNLLEVIRKTLPEDGILFADMTTPAYIGISEYPCYHEKTYLHPVGFGTLGLALPAAIGAKLAQPKKTLCVLTGDGGFQFTMQELMVACTQKMTLPIIIWNNNGFGEIRRNEEVRHPGETIAVDHQNPDFIKLAQAYGITGVRVNSAEEIEKALQSSLARQKPTIIEINV